MNVKPFPPAAEVPEQNSTGTAVGSMLHTFPSLSCLTAHPKTQGQMETWTKRRQIPVHPADKSQDIVSSYLQLSTGNN